MFKDMDKPESGGNPLETFMNMLQGKTEKKGSDEEKPAMEESPAEEAPAE